MDPEQFYTQFESARAEDRLAVIAHLLHRLTQEWYVHARVILEDDPRGAAAILEIAAECLGLVDHFCADFLAAPLRHECKELVHDAFLANPDLAHKDQVHAALASIAVDAEVVNWQDRSRRSSGCRP